MRVKQLTQQQGTQLYVSIHSCIINIYRPVCARAVQDVASHIYTFFQAKMMKTMYLLAIVGGKQTATVFA